MEAKTRIHSPRASSAPVSIEGTATIQSRALGPTVLMSETSTLRAPQGPILLEILEAIALGSHGTAIVDFTLLISRTLIALSGVFDIFVAIVSGLRGKYNAHFQICGSVEVCSIDTDILLFIEVLQLCEQIIKASIALQNSSDETSAAESEYAAVNLSKRLSELCDRLLQQGYSDKAGDAKERYMLNISASFVKSIVQVYESQACRDIFSNSSLQIRRPR